MPASTPWPGTAPGSLGCRCRPWPRVSETRGSSRGGLVDELLFRHPRGLVDVQPEPNPNRTEPNRRAEKLTGLMGAGFGAQGAWPTTHTANQPRRKHLRMQLRENMTRQETTRARAAVDGQRGQRHSHQLCPPNQICPSSSTAACGRCDYNGDQRSEERMRATRRATVRRVALRQCMTAEATSQLDSSPHLHAPSSR